MLRIDNKVWKAFHQDFWLNFVCNFPPYMLFTLPMSSCSDSVIGEQSKCEALILQLSPSKYSHTNSCQTAFILWCTKRNSPLHLAWIELTVSCNGTNCKIWVTMRFTAFIQHSLNLYIQCVITSTHNSVYPVHYNICRWFAFPHHSMSVSAINEHHSQHISSTAILLSIPGLLVGV